MIQVVIAEDSPVVREHLAWLLRRAQLFQVVGLASDGEQAVTLTRQLKPDVVLMDIHMPRMNGYEATRRIMAEAPTPIVMVSASLGEDETIMSFEALSAGALTLLAKPPAPGQPDEADSAARLCDTVRLMAGVKVVRRWPRKREQGPGTGGRKELFVPHSPTAIPCSTRKVRIVAIGASTGGPQTLVQIVQRLPGDLATPILVVQHIAPGFIPGLVRWLAGKTPLKTALARAGESVSAGTLYLAPDGWQMGIDKEGKLQLSREKGEGDFCPSVSSLFASVAESYGRSAVGVILTGMGRDGVAGLRLLRAAGGVTVAQDEESSVVFGMPGEAIRERLVDYILPPSEIARLIVSLAASRGAASAGSGEEVLTPC